MEDSNSPEMSVVLATERYETIRKTVRHLRAQTVSRRLEIVIVTPSGHKLGLQTSDLKDFKNFLVVEIGEMKSLSSARAAGIRQATAPLVALAESHSYPDPNWAEALIEAHRNPWAAVGPAIGNANPASMISWASLFLDYGRWLEPAEAKVMDDLPGRNSSYKRPLLLQYGDQLEALLESEIVLHLDLQARGYQLYFEPKAKTYHLNVSLLGSWLIERFNTGRSYAGVRAQNWRWLKRFIYTGGAPLIPLVRLWRILQDIKRCGRDRDLLPQILPALFVSLIASAVGEMVGYAIGIGGAIQKVSLMELYKAQHVADHDRRAEIS